MAQRWRRSLRRWARPLGRRVRPLGRRARPLGRLAPALGAAAVLLAMPAGAPRAGSLEGLVMPGPLAAAHADLESKCGKCHAPFDRARERQLCLDCHDGVAADQRAKQGFHGLHPAAASADCRTCHAEHRGRQAHLAALDPASFDHDRTDFPLAGAHRRVACEACHVPGKPHREAPGQCVDCHRADDPHHGQMGSACADCHGADGWGGARFDHAKTDFQLTGAHAKVACALCHPGERYQETPRDCATCHALDDSHHGRFGTRCQECHSTADWKERRFDHARDTDFALTGAHAELACEGCHRDGGFEKKLPTDCQGCHRADDVHAGRNGPRCADCHDTGAWKPARFDHASTKFPLHGAHARLACTDCHTRPVAVQKLGTACIDCHRGDDPHRGQMGSDCTRCHGEASWTERVRFDHDLARFPLLGMHAVTACEACHTTPAYRDTETRCAACHGDEDPHHGRLGAACETCHNPNAWRAWRFDHAAETRFALVDAHAGLACESCHRTAAAPGAPIPKLGSTCVTCHLADDPHHESFGRDCERCHRATDWREVSIGR